MRATLYTNEKIFETVLDKHATEALANFFIRVLNDIVENNQNSNVHRSDCIKITKNEIIVPARFIKEKLNDNELMALFYRYFAHENVLKKKKTARDMSNPAKTYVAVIFDKKKLEKLFEKIKTNEKR